MTPEDVPAAITAETLFPWLHAIAPPVEPTRTLVPVSQTATAEPHFEVEPLRPAA